MTTHALTHARHVVRPRSLARLAGGGLLAATGAIHLDLYLTGYRSIPTIGWLFLLQVIVAFLLAAAVLVSDSRIAAAGGALFALSTLGGYLLSIWVGLFGFKEVRTTAGIAAGILEVATVLVLGIVALSPVGEEDHVPPPARDLVDRAERHRWWLVPSVAAASGILLGVAVTSSGTSTAGPSHGAARIETRRIGGINVLTNSAGRTLYWFAPDSSSASRCYGTCAAYWPPVTGHAVAPSGVPGTFRTITRQGGELQVTYNRHPLYTYIGDTGPGQAHGNNLNLNGGVWHEMTVSG